MRNNKIKALFVRHKEILLYLVFGAATTAVDWGLSFILYASNVNVHLSDVIAWGAAVISAYLTSRKFVFESKKRGFSPILKEASEFAASRVLTLVFQEILVFMLHSVLQFNKYTVKLLSAFVVVSLNYILSKLIVFGKNRK